MILHAVALAFDHDGLGMMQEAIEQSGSEGTVVVEDLRPLLVDTVGGDVRGAMLIAVTEDLKDWTLDSSLILRKLII